MTAKRLTACPQGSHKCVSSLDTQEYCAMEPVNFSGSPAEAKAAVLEVVRAHPRTEVIEETDDYIKATFKTRVIRFTDTVEFEIDADDLNIHFRSESVPYAGSDLGANRKRMTAVRAALVEKLA